MSPVVVKSVAFSGCKLDGKAELQPKSVEGHSTCVSAPAARGPQRTPSPWYPGQSVSLITGKCSCFLECLRAIFTCACNKERGGRRGEQNPKPPYLGGRAMPGNRY